MPRFQETVVKLSKNAVPSEHSCCSQGMLLLFPGSSFCCFQKLLLLFPGNSLRCSQGTSSTVPREQLWLFPGNDFLSVIYGEQATPRRCHARKKWCPGKRSTFYCRLHSEIRNISLRTFLQCSESFPKILSSFFNSIRYSEISYVFSDTFFAFSLISK